MLPVADPAPASSAQAKSAGRGLSGCEQPAGDHERRAAHLADQHHLPRGVSARARSSDEVGGAVAERRCECQDESDAHDRDPRRRAVRSEGPLREGLHWTIWLTGLMPADWSRDAPNLMIALDRTGAALALQIQEHLRVAIREVVWSPESDCRPPDGWLKTSGSRAAPWSRSTSSWWRRVTSTPRSARAPGSPRLLARSVAIAPGGTPAATPTAEARDRLRVRHPRSRLGSAARLGLGGG